MCSNAGSVFRKFSYFCYDLRRGFIQFSSLRRISVSAVLGRKYFRSPVRYTKNQREVQDSTAVTVNSGRLVTDTTDEEESFWDNLLDRSLYIKELGHQVFVVQPYVKWGPQKKRLTTPELQLREAVTLIKTLRNWKVVEEKLISLDGMDKPRLFGSGQLDNLKEIIDSNQKITAVFISVNMLKVSQQLYLQQFFQVPVYDRYTIVIHIFREHATTKEAKLQIKLAELPYLWSRFKNIGKGSYLNFDSGNQMYNVKWKGKEFHNQLLKQRERKIRYEIEKLREHRKIIKKNRIRNEIPNVAVVGYTNSGKTSLIKAFTGKDNLEPQDYLFATLDVSVHKGTLPCSMDVLFVDTIGFMSDIPTALFESFISTLEDVKLADVVIHVRDISHPDNIAQNQNVIDSLKLLDVEGDVFENIITVGNKIDLMTSDGLEKYRNEDMIFISAKKKTGINVLLQKIEENILKVTGRKVVVIKVKTGGEEYYWLLENTTVTEEIPFPEDHNYILMRVIMTAIAMARFKSIFIKDFHRKRKVSPHMFGNYENGLDGKVTDLLNKTSQSTIFK